jgi:hypothetical protein
VKRCNEDSEVRRTKSWKSSSNNERGMCLGGWVVQGKLIGNIFILGWKGSKFNWKHIYFRVEGWCKEEDQCLHIS